MTAPRETAAQPEGRLDRPGAELDWSSEGEGPLVVHAHGMFGSRASDDRWGLFDWAPLTASGRRLVRYDARGHGRSTGRPEPGDYRWPRLADDLFAVLDHLQPTGPVDVAGASMGTGTLLTAAVREPARFRRLVLMIPPTAWETRAAAAQGYLDGADAVERDGMPAFLAAMSGGTPPPVFAEAFALLSQEDVAAVAAGPDVSETLLPSVLRGAAGSDLPDPQALAALPHPALVLAWEGDPVHPVSTAERLAELLPGAELHISGTAAEVRGWAGRIAAFLAG
ncbi:alpha/beta fold hydrolase [Streptacidiphilus griseoplanus]|uniref:alpha/beta fold hydrolase n=1 Tax=Peterkaempfera griseoplana TaxID=66896 RepID=UPI0006E400D4|nr:alpha/beta fold hydrolase [Peterkaempfera griseoplana]